MKGYHLKALLAKISILEAGTLISQRFLRADIQDEMFLFTSTRESKKH